NCDFFFQAEDGIRDGHVTGVQTCALPICAPTIGCRLCDSDLEPPGGRFSDLPGGWPVWNESTAGETNTNIGRGSRNHIKLDDPLVASRHCCVVFENGRCLLAALEGNRRASDRDAGGSASRSSEWRSPAHRRGEGLTLQRT